MKYLMYWFGGYLDLSFSGHQMSRFLNLCSKNDIYFTQIQFVARDLLRARMPLKQIYLLKPFLRKTRTVLRIRRRHGFPFFAKKHPFLCCLPLVFTIALGIFIYQRTFLWEICIIGNEKILAEEVQTLFAASDVKIGTKRKKIDCAQLESAMRQHFSDLAWVTIYQKGTVLYVEIRESLYGISENEEEDIRRIDLIAERDAYISKMITRFGTAVAKADSYVKKGDILIRGEYAIYDDSGVIREIRYRKAEGWILGEVKYEFDLPLTEAEILAMRIAGTYSNARIHRLGLEKLETILNHKEKFEEILEKQIRVIYEEERIYFHCRVRLLEEIGIHQAMEEE